MRARRLFGAARRRIRVFLAHPSCDSASRKAFGSWVTGDAVAHVVADFERETWPRLVVTDPDVLGEASGAYVASNDTIYLNRDLLDESDGQVIKILLHEIGHAIDRRVQPVEGQGDEGAIFAALVNGEALSPAALVRMQKIDDHGTITVGGLTLAAEFARKITIDGDLSDWDSTERIDTPANAVTGYALYGTVQNGFFDLAILDTQSSDLAIGANTTIWLNTDLNRNTGYNVFGGITTGAEYNIVFDATGTPYLYTGAAGATQVSSTPLSFALTPDGKGLEIAIPSAALTPSGGTTPTAIALSAQITNAAAAGATTYLPGDFTYAPQYKITDPGTLLPKTATHRVAIVYSGTSAALYFNQTAYSDLFMAAQNQTRMAGVSYDVIDESQLTDVANLVKYDALIFPAMPDVNTAQLPQIMTALTSAVYDYHIGIITSGDFLTNDQAGNPLPGNAYVNMATLLNLQRVSGGNSGAVSVTANDVSNPIMSSYTAGQVIHTYASVGYTEYEGVSAPADVLVNQNVTGVGVIPGVVQTTTGGTNVQFATAGLFGDSNLLSHVIQGVVLGTQAGVALHTSRQAGIFAARMDMDQSQFPSDASPVNDAGVPQPGIYDKLVPILQQWRQQYNFVGSYYFNIGDTPNAADPSTTNWTRLLPYYQAIEALGGEIGNHSYTHLINPPTVTVTEATVGDTPAGSTQITLSGVPSFAGVTVGMFVSGPGIGTNTVLPGDGSAVANSQITAISGNTITISYVPGGYGTGNAGTIAAIPAGTKLTFSIPSENTNFLQTTGTVLNAVGDPFTYDFEFNQSKQIQEAQLGHPIYGAAVPGATETYATSQNILPYYPTVAATATDPGYTGYLTGGWTGIGSGYPSAFGYMNPTDQNTVYLAPNITFDFSEIQYEGKSIADALADWTAQLSAINANAAGTPIVVWPIHDYGAAAWDTSDSGATSPYTTQLYSDFIAQAYNANYEFVTLEQAASRLRAQQKATINYTTAGNVITATATPDPTAPDLGAMALSVINGGTNVIQNVGTWYAYNSTEVFTPYGGGSYTITLGATQDDVTHIAALPSRADLLSVTGDGTNLNFSMTGDGQVTVDLKNVPTNIVSIQGAPLAKLVGDVLTLSFTDTLIAPLYAPLRHDVAIEQGPTAYTTALNDIIFGTAGNDIFMAPGGGSDTIYGDGGMDTIVYSGGAANYTVVTNADGSQTVTDVRAGSPDGTDTLYNIANVFFGAPSILSILASGTRINNGSGAVGTGSVVTLTVSFTQPVTVTGGLPTLTLNDGATATYTGGSGTNALLFSYTVSSGENTALLAATALNLPSGTTITNVIGSNATLTPVPALSGTLQIDTLIPTITAITTSGNRITAGSGVLGAGASVTLTVSFSEAVFVAGGAPTLTLNDGGVATYASGSGTATLTFTHVVTAGQNTPDLTISSFNLPAGVTVGDGAGNAASLATAANYNPAGILQIDTVIPTITAIATSGTGIVAGAGVLDIGAVVTLTVTLNKAVVVAGGTPTLTLNDGGVATYVGGSGTNALTFNYVVAAGQTTPDLIVSSFSVPAGTTLQSAAGTNADLSAATNYNPAGILKIATGNTQITSITTSGTGIINGVGDLNAGKTVTLTVNFSQAVTVAGGNPTLSLSDGGTATYTGGSGTAALTFNYVVQSGRNAADLQVIGLKLPTGGTIKDARGVSAGVTVANGYNPAGILQIDTTPPKISAISTSGPGITNGAGSLPAGSTVVLTATFNEIVTIQGGGPSLALNDGGTATYTGGSGTTALQFSYTVLPGQNTPDLTVTGLSGTLLDGAGNQPVLPIAAINPAGVLKIATTPPKITVTGVAGNALVTALKAAVGFAITGTTTGVENGQVVSVTMLNAAQQQVGSYAATVTNNAWSASVTSAQAKALADGIYSVSAAVSDKAGNLAAPAALGFVVDEISEMPTLRITNSLLNVTAGGSVQLGITATPVTSANVLSVVIKGLPSYETISAPTGNVVTKAQAANGTYTWTVTGTAGATITGLSLASTYTGTGHPIATLSVMASSAAHDGQPLQTTAAMPLIVIDPPAATPTVAPITSKMVLTMSEDAWNGDAQFIVSIDGKQLGSPQAVTASHAAGKTQAFTFSGIAEAFNPHNIVVSYVNDANGGTPAADRNLYLASIQFDGVTVPGSTAAFYTDGSKSFTASAPVNWRG